MEGRLAGVLQAQHDHARHPEEEDVVGGLHDASGVEIVQVRRLVRPPQRRMRPQSGGEPRVQHVLVLPQVNGATAWAGGRVLILHNLVLAGVAVPDGDAVPPPKLAADAPVSQVFHPVLVDAGEPLRDDTHCAVAHHVEGGLGQRCDAHEPLLADHRLHHLRTPLAVPNGVPVLLYALQQPRLLEVFHNLDAGLKAVQPRVGAGLGVHRAVGVHDRDDGQPVALAEVEVCRVMARRDLEGAGAELRLDGIVANDGDAPAEDGQHHFLADELRVARVVGVHGNGGVAEQRLGAGRRDSQAAVAIHQGVVDVVEMALGLAVLDLQVGEGRGTAGAPVDDALAAVDQALSVQVHKGMAHGAAGAGVEREGLPRPIAAHAEAAVLLADAAPRLADPVPDALQELLAAEVVAGEAFGGKLSFHDHLRRDARMVEAGEPEGGLAQHAAPTGQGVLDRRALGVAEVELAGHVRRRLNDDKGALPRLYGGGEVPGVHPLLVEALLYGGRVIGAGKLLGSLEGHGAACSMGLAAKPEHGAPSIVPHGATLHGGAWGGRVRCRPSHQFESSRVEFFRGEETTSTVV